MMGIPIKKIPDELPLRGLTTASEVLCGQEHVPEGDLLGETDTDVTEKIDEPRQYRVILLNDDYTTFDFVVKVLVNIFRKTVEEAVRITSDVHHKGHGVCGIYSKQIAETKVALVEEASQKAGYPLRCTMEEL